MVKVSGITKVLLILALAAIAVTLYVFTMSFIITGCGMSGSPYGHYEYFVEITGLANYTGGPSTDIFLPVPVFNGQPAYTSGDLSTDIPTNGSLIWIGHGFDEYSIGVKLAGDWKLNVSETAYGKMLVLHTDCENLTDVRLSLVNDYLWVQRRADRGSDRVMSPLFNLSDSLSGANYTTCAIVDGDMHPIRGSNGTITCNLTLIVEEGKNGKRFDANVRKLIAPGELQTIPLNVSIAVSPDMRMPLY